MNKMKKEECTNFTIEREFEKYGGLVQLIHTTELVKPYLCTCRMPGKSEESSFLLMTDNFKRAHQQFEIFVKQLKNGKR